MYKIFQILIGLFLRKKKLQRKCWNCNFWLQERMGLCNNEESPFYETNRSQHDWCGKIKY